MTALEGTHEIPVAPREVYGKKVKRLRRAGWIPANVFGPTIEPTSIQVEERVLQRALGHASPTTLFTLRGLPTEQRVIVKEVQRIPTTGRLAHGVFYAISEQKRLHADLPLHFVGEAPATQQDGILLHALDSVRVECYPRDLPERIDVDVSVLTDFDTAIHVSDLSVPPGVTILDDPGELVAKVLPPKRLVEEEEAAAEAAAAAVPPEAAPAAEEAEKKQ